MTATLYEALRRMNTIREGFVVRGPDGKQKTDPNTSHAIKCTHARPVEWGVGVLWRRALPTMIACPSSASRHHGHGYASPATA